METYLIHGHGCELQNIITVPKGINIIMYCHSKKLYMDECFEHFSWEITQNSYANLNKLIVAMKNNDIMKNEFCLYKQGDRIRNMLIFGDDENEFRSGIYQTPIIFNEITNKEISEIDMISDRKSIDQLSKITNCETEMMISSPKYIFAEQEKFTLPKLFEFIDGSEGDITLIMYQCRSGCNNKVFDNIGLDAGVKLRDISSARSGLGAGLGAGAITSSGSKIATATSDSVKAYKLKNKKDRTSNYYLNRLSDNELRKICNNNGLSCKDKSGKYLSRKNIISRLIKVMH